MILSGLLAASLAVAASSGPAVAGPVDLARYMGTWYEIAVIPNKPQEGCVDTVVHYRLRKGPGFELLNTCWKGSKFKPYHGTAKPVAEGDTARFTARFFLLFTSDYWIVDLDPEYRWAAVGGPARDRLWVISREAALAPETYAAVVARAKAQGFPVEKLVKTVHTGRKPPADPWSD